MFKFVCKRHFVSLLSQVVLGRLGFDFERGTHVLLSSFGSSCVLVKIRRRANFQKEDLYRERPLFPVARPNFKVNSDFFLSAVLETCKNVKENAQMASRRI